jgi:hypothetical protein
MNPRNFIQLLQEDGDFRKRVRRTVLNEMQSAAQRKSITIDDLHDEEIETLAKSFVERGLHEKP